MESPFKVRSLNFEDADNSSVQTDVEQQEVFYAGLMKIVWPNDACAVPTKPSPIKSKTVPIWNKSKVGIVDHLFDVKLHLELLASRGQLTTSDEHASVLVESITIPETRDWMKQTLKTRVGVVQLYHLLLRRWHQPSAERAALAKLEQLPMVWDDVQALCDAFDHYSAQVSDKFVTDAGRAHLFLVRVPVHVKQAGQLDHLLDLGWSCVRLQHEALRLSATVVGAAPATAVRPPAQGMVYGGAPLVQPSAPALPPPPAQQPPAYQPEDDGPSPMVLGAVHNQTQHHAQSSAGRGGGNGRGRGGRNGRGRGGRATPPQKFGRGAPQCFTCLGWGHVSAACPTVISSSS